MDVVSTSPNDVYALNNKGNALGKLGKYIDATSYYEKAIKILKSNQSSQSTSYSHLASTVIPIYKYIAATQVYMLRIPISDSQNITQDQSLILVQINYAKDLEKIGEYRLAIIQFKGILQSDPYNGCVLLGKADALDKSGQHNEALEDYDIAKRLNPVCGTGTTDIQRTVNQPSQWGALLTCFSQLFSHH